MIFWASFRGLKAPCSLRGRDPAAAAGICKLKIIMRRWGVIFGKRVGASFGGTLREFGRPYRAY
jgi:hypothetical protein